MITFKEYDDRTDQYVTDEIKRRKLARHIVNATDDYRMKKGKATFTMPHHTGSSTIHVYLRKMPGPSKGVMAYNYDIKFNEEVEIQERAVKNYKYNKNFFVDDRKDKLKKMLEMNI